MCFVVTDGREKEDYDYVFDELLKWSGVDKSSYCLHAIVSDQEAAMVAAMKSSNLYCGHFTAIVFCELHLRQNFERKLKADFGFSDDDIRVGHPASKFI